ncbi:MAG: helix-turn-helix domain-containing protein [Rhizobiaceae bacterium]|nr:helix-turn-helix domain-containing protein [Rhizobiaceae bacterium]
MTMRGRNSSLPGVLREIADVAGVEAAWALARAHGGTTVYIPRDVDEKHWLAQLIGLEPARRLCVHFRVRVGVDVLIPMARLGQQQERLLRSLEAGLSAQEAASVAGMHERTAYRARARMKKDVVQPDDKQFKLL